MDRYNHKNKAKRDEFFEKQRFSIACIRCEYVLFRAFVENGLFEDAERILYRANLQIEKMSIINKKMIEDVKESQKEENTDIFNNLLMEEWKQVA